MNFSNAQSNNNDGLLVLTKSDGLLDLAKFSNLVNAAVACGWVAFPAGKEQMDLDIAAFMLEEDERVHVIHEEVCFYGLTEQVGVKLLGDKRTGSSSNLIQEDDEEKMAVKLLQVPDKIKSIVFVVTIYEAAKRKQVFGSAKEAYVKLIDVDSKEELLKVQVNGSEHQMDTAIVFCRLVRNNKGWSFEAIGDGYTGDLNDILVRYLASNYVK